MSRRRRAIGFAAVALACAALAAALAGGYRSSVEAQLGPLVPVVVAREDLEARRPLAPGDARRLLEVRRVPARFAPPGVLAAPLEAIGLSPPITIPAGSYVAAAQLRPPRGGHRPPPGLAAGREPLEITVSGAEALGATGRDPVGSRVDVLVTSEPGPGGRGETRLAAGAVELLGLRESGAGDGGFTGAGAGAWTAIVAVTRAQALRLIEAQNFAREVRLIPSSG